MEELSRMSLGKKPNLEKGVSELQIMKLGKARFKVCSNKFGEFIKLKEPEWISKSLKITKIYSSNMLSSRNKILEAINEYLEIKELYLTEINFYPKKILGLITPSIEGVLYKKDSIDD